MRRKFKENLNVNQKLLLSVPFHIKRKIPLLGNDTFIYGLNLTITIVLHIPFVSLNFWCKISCASSQKHYSQVRKCFISKVTMNLIKYAGVLLLYLQGNEKSTINRFY